MYSFSNTRNKLKLDSRFGANAQCNEIGVEHIITTDLADTLPIGSIVQEVMMLSTISTLIKRRTSM